jgi:hypothetical protein
MPFLNLTSDMRVGAIGQTQAGKTFIMEQALREQPRVVVVDDKQRVDWPGYSLTYDPNAAFAEDRIIVRHRKPIPDDWWPAMMSSLHERGGGIIYIDEAAEQTTPNTIPAGLRTVVRLGAQIGVGVWWSAQEATAISNVLIRQSDILLLFFNQGASDRDKLIRTAGDIAEVTASLNLYEFLVYQSYGRGWDPSDIPVYRYEVAA